MIFFLVLYYFQFAFYSLADEDTSSGVASLIDSDGGEGWPDDEDGATESLSISSTPAAISGQFTSTAAVTMSSSSPAVHYTSPLQNPLQQSNFTQHNNIESQETVPSSVVNHNSVVNEEPSLDLFASDAFSIPSFDDSNAIVSQAHPSLPDPLSQGHPLLAATPSLACPPHPSGLPPSSMALQWPPLMTATLAPQPATLPVVSSPTVIPNGLVLGTAPQACNLQNISPTALTPASIAALNPFSQLPQYHPINSIISVPSIENNSLQLVTSAGVTDNINPAVTSIAVVTSAPLVSSVNNCLASEEAKELYIPRLLDGGVKDSSKIQVKLWRAEDVAAFLKKNDCASYCQHFIDKVSV